MTNEEAIEHIKELYDWYIEEEPLSEHFLKHDATNMAIKALENQEKYKWHDLRGNPEDLPQHADQVLCEWVGGSHNWYDVMFYRKENGRSYFTFDGTHKSSIVNQPKFSNEGQVIAWRENEPFGEEE